jgi:choline dehydrogenase-like flavoprotein
MRDDPGMKSADPRELPLISLGYLADPLDRRVLEFGIDAATELVSRRPVRALIDGLDRVDAEVALDRLTTYQHSVGTCAMGSDSATAVVDERCLVHGFENLWIGDASVMPRIPAVNTLLTTLMIAERCAEFVCEVSNSRSRNEAGANVVESARTSTDGDPLVSTSD